MKATYKQLRQDRWILCILLGDYLVQTLKVILDVFQNSSSCFMHSVHRVTRLLGEIPAVDGLREG